MSVVKSEHWLEDSDTLVIIEVFGSEEVEENLTSIAGRVVGDEIESSQLLNESRGSVSSVIEPTVGEIVGRAGFEGLSSGLTFSNELLIELQAFWLGHSSLNALSVGIVELITTVKFNDLCARFDFVVACSRADAKRGDNSIVSKDDRRR